MFKSFQCVLLSYVFCLLNTCHGSEIEIPMMSQDQESHKATRVHRDLEKIGRYNDQKALCTVKILRDEDESYTFSNPIGRCFCGTFFPCYFPFTIPCLVQNTVCFNWCKDSDEVWDCYRSLNAGSLQIEGKSVAKRTYFTAYDSYEILSVKDYCCFDSCYWGKPRLYHEYISIPMDENGWWIPRTTGQIGGEINLRKSEILKKKCPHGVTLFVDCPEGQKPKELKCEVKIKKKDKKWHAPEYGYVNQTTVTRTYNTPLKLTHSEKRETHRVRVEIKAGFYEEIEIDVPCEEGKVAGKAWFEDEKIKNLRRELIVSDFVNTFAIKIPVRNPASQSRRHHVSEDSFTAHFDLNLLAQFLSESGIMDKDDVLQGRKEKIKCEISNVQDKLSSHPYFIKRIKTPEIQVMH